MNGLLSELTIIISIMYITVPVPTVTITPAGDNNVVDIIEGKTQTFTCTTDSSSSTWIHWYIYYYLYYMYSTGDNSDNHPSW
jgi:hypothetical protein